MQQFSRLRSKSMGELLLCPVFSHGNSRMSAWGSCTKNIYSAWPGPAHRTRSGWLDPLWWAKGIPAAVPSCGPVPSQLDFGGWRQPNDWKKTPQWDIQSWEGVPILGAGRDQGGIRALLLNAQAGTSHPPLFPQYSVLLLSSSATLWKT